MRSQSWTQLKWVSIFVLESLIFVSLCSFTGRTNFFIGLLFLWSECIKIINVIFHLKLSLRLWLLPIAQQFFFLSKFSLVDLLLNFFPLNGINFRRVLFLLTLVQNHRFMHRLFDIQMTLTGLDILELSFQNPLFPVIEFFWFVLFSVIL